MHRAEFSPSSTHQQSTTRSARRDLSHCQPANEFPVIPPKQDPCQESPHQHYLGPSRSLHCYLHWESLHREEVNYEPLRVPPSVPDSVKQAMSESGLCGFPHTREPTHYSTHLRWSGARLVHHPQNFLIPRTTHPIRPSSMDGLPPQRPPNPMKYRESRPKLKSADRDPFDAEALRPPASEQAGR